MIWPRLICIQDEEFSRYVWVSGRVGEFSIIKSLYGLPRVKIWSVEHFMVFISVSWSHVVGWWDRLTLFILFIHGQWHCDFCISSSRVEDLGYAFGRTDEASCCFVAPICSCCRGRVSTWVLCMQSIWSSKNYFTLTRWFLFESHSIFVVIIRYNILSGIFPWPVQVKYSGKFRFMCMHSCPEVQLKLKLLHPFGQLQSVLEDVRNLNFVLNHPFGARYFCLINQYEFLDTLQHIYKMINA